MKKLFNPTKLYDRDYISIEDLSEALNVSTNTIYRISYRGDLKKIKYMGRNYWKTAEVISYLDGKGILTTEGVS
jgi:Zn-dependent peptidase ImmA (M78 family)